MIEVRVVRTGSIRIRPSNWAGDMHHSVRRCRLDLLDRDWTQPLPIYTYLIEDGRGSYLLERGSALSAESGVPAVEPAAVAADIHVEPGDEIGPRLRSVRASTRARTCGCSYCRTCTMTTPTA